MKFEQVFIQTGSNLEPRHAFLGNAVSVISSDIRVSEFSQSSVLETEPWGNTEQPKFLNQILQFRFAGSPLDLLGWILSIEKENGRTRDGRMNMPRTLDLDVLLFGQWVISLPQLEIPHPRMHLREFVLQPLCEIAPDFVHPVLKKPISEILRQLRNE